MKQIKFIQLLPTVVDMGGGVSPANPGEEPMQWSVYKGEPGDSEWLADFRVRVDAMRYAQAQAMLYGAQVHEGEM